ncbi:MAG: UDP-N-acetylmuramoyl-tripeptide--D-alanyl-D-alanine ligase [Oligoflexia bacterium]|nr:UDP-N-acetylmuramoyl-tripeptide--D-alanyl-D-alanine ligase [Oligoflexia bacterium]
MSSLWTHDQLVGATGGRWIQTGSRPFSGVGTDTRQNLNDKIFCALKGENFDAHEFAGQAVSSGASCLVVEKDILPVKSDVSVLRVSNVLEALQNFAKWHRQHWPGKLVALTGSNGKTTTKEFITQILAQKYPVLATQGNLNNHIGVPLTLLGLRPTHKFAVVEMGMNHAGEIKKLTEIALPDVVIVTNVGRAHIEFFGTVEGIAQAKEEIYEAAPLKATRIYNLDNNHTATMRARAPGGCRVITYSSFEKGADVTLREKVLTLDYVEVQGVIGGEPGHAKIPVFGKQQVSNAMAAAAVAMACGIDSPLIWKGLAKAQASWGRGQVVDLECGAKVLFDAYNANPDSMAMAIENFSKVSSRGKKLAVIGEMLELGKDSAQLHREVGELLATVQLEAVFVIGPHAQDLASGLRGRGFSKKLIISDTYQENLATEFAHMLETGDIVLVKGSRGMKMERFVKAFHPLHFVEKH